MVTQTSWGVVLPLYSLDTKVSHFSRYIGLGTLVTLNSVFQFTETEVPGAVYTYFSPTSSRTGKWVSYRRKDVPNRPVLEERRGCGGWVLEFRTTSVGTISGWTTHPERPGTTHFPTDRSNTRVSFRLWPGFTDRVDRGLTCEKVLSDRVLGGGRVLSVQRRLPPVTWRDVFVTLDLSVLHTLHETLPTPGDVVSYLTWNGPLHLTNISRRNWWGPGLCFHS